MTRSPHPRFSEIEGVYFTGDGARRDADGYYWITGRVGDITTLEDLSVLEKLCAGEEE